MVSLISAVVLRMNQMRRFRSLSLYLILGIFIQCKRLHSQNGSAVVIELTGSPVIKGVNQQDWLPLLPKSFLQPGDKIFTPSGSSVNIKYQTSQIQIKVPPGVLFKIESKAPEQSHMIREFLPPDIHREELLAHLQKSGKSSIKRFRLIVPKKPLPIYFPKGRVEIVAQKYPVSLPIRVPNIKQKIWTIAWFQDGATLKQIWNGYLKDQKVPLGKKGSYVIQFFSEDDKWMSQPIYIDCIDLIYKVKKGNNIKDLSHIVEDRKGTWTRLVYDDVNI